MRKIKLLSAAVFGSLALSAASAATASAAHQWLANGFPISTPKSATTTGTWLVLGLGIFGVKLHLVCNGTLIGTVGPGAADEITAVTSLSGSKLVTCELLSTEKGLCEGSLKLYEAVNLPWKTELLLTIEGQVKDRYTSGGKGAPAFSIRCLLSGGSWSLELCEGNILSDPLVNGAAGVESSVTNQPTEKCNNSASSAHIYAISRLTTLLNGEKLTVD